MQKLTLVRKECCQKLLHRLQGRVQSSEERQPSKHAGRPSPLQEAQVVWFFSFEISKINDSMGFFFLHVYITTLYIGSLWTFEWGLIVHYQRL